jgi:hypothetical protein
VQSIALDIATAPHHLGRRIARLLAAGPVIELETAALHRGWGSVSIAHTRHQHEDKDRLFLLGPPMGLLILGLNSAFPGGLFFLRQIALEASRSHLTGICFSECN